MSEPHEWLGGRCEGYPPGKVCRGLATRRNGTLCTSCAISDSFDAHEGENEYWLRCEANRSKKLNSEVRPCR